MNFKLRYSIRDISVPDEGIQLSLRINHEVKIKIIKPSEKYLMNSGGQNISFCEAELVDSPSEKNAKVLNEIIEGTFIPNDNSLPSSYQKIKIPSGKEIVIPSLSKFPQHFIDFVTKTIAELGEAIESAITIVRWYKDNRGSHSPFAFLDFTWTPDEVNWYPMPTSIHISVDSSTSGIQLTKGDEEVVLDLLRTENIEPVYHSLFREAWEQRWQNPRSSLIMAISAIEVSIKHLMGKKVPEATWLITKLQSPPVVQIFKEYLPTLLIDNKINGITILPPERMISELKKWILIRNEVTHLGKESLTGDKLKEMLLTIKDILHIIDFNCGYKWAINHVRKETLKEIGLKEL